MTERGSSAMDNERRAKRGAVVLLAAGSLIVLSACGTRLSDAQIAAGARVKVALQTAAAGNSNNGAGTTGDGNTGNGGGSIVGPGSTSNPTVGGGGLSDGGATGSNGGGGSGGGSHSGGGSGGGSNGGGGGSGGGAAAGAAPCTASGAPVIIGQDGSFSGLVGQSTGDIKLGMSVWAKYINAHGGVGCHPVQLYQEDDASDPSTAAANVNDLVKNKHAIALVGMDIPIVIASGRSAADQLGIPIVGGDLTATDWTQDPNMFPSGGSALQVYGGSVASAVKKTGMKKVGLLYCVEASICGVIHQNFANLVKASGGELINQQSVSLTQSSFTSECQNLKSAGAQIVWTAVDGSALQRIASSCKSIGYNPVLETAGIAASPNAFGDPNVQTDSLFIGSNETPFVATGTAALNEFHAAFKQYTGSDAPDQSAMKGWVSGQLFAAAINALGTSARTKPLTTAMVFQGLYLLHGETLGGLIPPMTYQKGKPAPIVNCYTTIFVDKHGISSPFGNKFTCS